MWKIIVKITLIFTATYIVSIKVYFNINEWLKNQKKNNKIKILLYTDLIVKTKETGYLVFLCDILRKNINRLVEHENTLDSKKTLIDEIIVKRLVYRHQDYGLPLSLELKKYIDEQQLYLTKNILNQAIYIQKQQSELFSFIREQVLSNKYKQYSALEMSDFLHEYDKRSQKLNLSLKQIEEEVYDECLSWDRKLLKILRISKTKGPLMCEPFVLLIVYFLLCSRLLCCCDIR